jgi:hypothetical protein
MTDPTHDFDFIFGSWNVHNSKLADVTDSGCDQWVEFGATSEVTPILGGIGHVERIVVPVPTDGGRPFEGFTLRSSIRQPLSGESGGVRHARRVCSTTQLRAGS